MNIVRTLCALAAASLAASAASAQSGADSAASYPKDSVKLVVSYAAGNTTDVLARAIGERLSARWKQPVVIENKPGVAGSLGAAQVAKAAPDGYTLLVSAVAAMAVNPHVYEKVGYDPFRDFEYIHLAAWAPLLCVVSAQSPVNSFSDLVKLSQQKEVRFGTAGSGNIPHLTMETFKARFGLKGQHIPYKGASNVLTDLVGGQIDLSCDSASVALPLLQAGRIKPIVVTSQKRLPVLPNVPAMAEQYPGYLGGAWLGFMAPRGVPAAVLEKINADIAAVLAEKTMRDRLEGLGFEVLSQGPAAFAQRARTDHEQYGRIARELKLKAE